jgi:hypothetical protein
MDTHILIHEPLARQANYTNLHKTIYFYFIFINLRETQCVCVICGQKTFAYSFMHRSE